MSPAQLGDLLERVLNTAAVGALIGATISWFVARQTSRSQREHWVSERRVQAYSGFLTVVAELRDLGRKPTTEEAHRLLISLTSVQLFGSISVINKAQQLQRDTGEVLFPDQSPYVDPRKYLFLGEDELVNAIRAELGLEPMPIPDERRNRAIQLKPGRTPED